MLQAFQLELIGKHHSGIDDCKSIVQIVQLLLSLGHKFDSPSKIPEDYNPKEDPHFVNFGSVTEPLSWQCSNTSCGIWNRPWIKSCIICDQPFPQKSQNENQYNLLEEIEVQ